MATIKELAKKAGVSPSTASIVVNGKAKQRKISPKTVQRVLEVAKEIGYTPNLSARVLRGAESNRYRIALYMTTDFRLTMMVRFLKGLQNHIRDQKIPVEFAVITYENGELHEVVTPSVLLQYHGTIVCNANQEDLDYLDKNDFSIPIVLYNRFLEKYSTVNIDNYRIGEFAAKHILHNKRDRVLLLDQESHFPGLEHRILGFEEYLEKNGIQFKQILTNNKHQSGYDIVRDLHKTEGLPDFIFSLSDTAALGSIRYLYQNNINVPQDVEVMAIGTIESEFHESSILPLSTIDVPIDEMAKECLNLVIHHLEDPFAKLQTILVPVEFHHRETTTNNDFI